MNRQIVRYYIDKYKNRFPEIHNEEIYKWKAVKHFKDNWNQYDSDFCGMLAESLSQASNLLDSGNYYPKKMLLMNADRSPDIVKESLLYLFTEDINLADRIETFRQTLKELNNINFPGSNVYQDHRAIMLYLCLMYPDKYYLYKYTMFKEFADMVDYPIKPAGGRVENVSLYQNLCDLLKYEIRQDQDLLKMHKDRITDDCFFDENLNLLTQDFIYAVVEHIREKYCYDRMEQGNGPDVPPECIPSEEAGVRKAPVSFTPTMVDYVSNTLTSKYIGDLGELWVLQYEKEKLIKAGKRSLAGKIEHTAKEKGDGTGYDIRSFDEEGNDIFIEVKTTAGTFRQPFYISGNELEKSRLEKDNYLLYRVYDYDIETNSGQLKILKGDLSHLCVQPVCYRVSVQ